MVSKKKIAIVTESLYDKHRPITFEDMIGNNHVVEAVKMSLERGKVPPVFMFTGITGTGKTTIARIIARELGVSRPIEINAASARGIDDVRALIDDAQHTSFSGGRKVYIIDECHKLTNEAQNALLKLLEDVSPIANFILCTTHPENVLPTIRSRCATYNFEPYNAQEVAELLVKISSLEKMTVSDKIIELIVGKGCGSMRLALNMLQSCSDCGEDVEKASRLIKEIDVGMFLEGEAYISKLLFDIYYKESDYKIVMVRIRSVIKEQFEKHKITDITTIKDGLIARLGAACGYCANDVRCSIMARMVHDLRAFEYYDRNTFYSRLIYIAEYFRR